MWKSNVSVECCEADTCAVRGSGHHSDSSVVGGRWSVWVRIFFFFFISPKHRDCSEEICVFLGLLCPQNGLSNINFWGQMFFCGEFVVKAAPLWVCMSRDWWGLLRLCSRAQTGLDLLGQGRKNTILAIAVGAVLIVRLLTTKQQQVQRFNSCYFTLVI